jgi:hypothetical protein
MTSVPLAITSSRAIAPSTLENAVFPYLFVETIQSRLLPSIAAMTVSPTIWIDTTAAHGSTK